MNYKPGIKKKIKSGIRHLHFPAIFAGNSQERHKSIRMKKIWLLIIGIFVAKGIQNYLFIFDAELNDGQNKQYINQAWN